MCCLVQSRHIKTVTYAFIKIKIILILLYLNLSIHFNRIVNWVDIIQRKASLQDESLFPQGKEWKDLSFHQRVFNWVFRFIKVCMSNLYVMNKSYDC